MKFIFWVFILLIVYCYFGYPLLLSLLTRIRARRVTKADIQPAVSVVLSVYNEEDVIEAKLRNLLDLDYPSEKMEILIGSDGSTDRTQMIVENFHAPGIHFFPHDQRRGKMGTINDLVQHAGGEILLFTDARQIFAKDALRELVKNFADEQVGSVSGELIFSGKEGGTAKGINLYWEYEKYIRKRESQLHSMLGATGAIYAVRSELYAALPDDVVLDDMYIPFKIIQKGYRAVFEEKARAYDRVAGNAREEHRRKARTLFGNYQIFCLFPGMFNPLRSPIAIQLFSHKFLRLMIPFLMVSLFIINGLLVYDSDFIYCIFFIMQIVFYILAILGALSRHRKYGILNLISKMGYIPYVFCLLNFSAMIGFLRFISAGQEVTWQKARKT